MKKFIALTLALFSATPAFADTDAVARGLAVQSLTVLNSIRAGPDIDERCAREGEPYAMAGNNAASGVSVSTGAQNTSITGVTTPASALSPSVKAIWVDNITISIDHLGLAQVIISNDTNARFYSFVWQGVLAANTPVVIPVRKIFRGFEIATGQVSLAIRNNLTGGSVTYIGALGVTGCRLTDDMNWGAAKVIEWVGDSIDNGTGPTLSANHRAFKVLDLFKSTYKYDVRLVIKSASGSTTSDHETWRKQGYHEIIGNPSLLVYAVGPNDAVTSVASATSIANITAFWNWFHARWPTAHMLVLSPGPLEDNTSQTNGVTLGAAESSWVTGVGSSLLTYCDITTAFDRTSGTTNYVASDTPGSRIHPNDTGHSAEASVINTCITSQNIKL